jgi:hypothetical protein
VISCWTFFKTLPSLVCVLLLSCTLLLKLFFNEILIARFGHKRYYNKTKTLYKLLPLRIEWICYWDNLSSVTANPNFRNGWIGDKYDTLLFSNTLTVTGGLANHFWSIPVQIDIFHLPISLWVFHPLLLRQPRQECTLALNRKLGFR